MGEDDDYDAAPVEAAAAVPMPAMNTGAPAPLLQMDDNVRLQLMRYLAEDLEGSADQLMHALPPSTIPSSSTSQQ